MKNLLFILPLIFISLAQAQVQEEESFIVKTSEIGVAYVIDDNQSHLPFTFGQIRTFFEIAEIVMLDDNLFPNTNVVLLDNEKLYLEDSLYKTEGCLPTPFLLTRSEVCVSQEIFY